MISFTVLSAPSRVNTPVSADDVFTPSAFTGERAADAFPMDCWFFWHHRHTDTVRASKTSDAAMPAQTFPIATWLH